MTAETDRSVDDAATLIIGQRVRAGCEKEFARWHERFNAIAARAPGYVEVHLRPPHQTEDQWVTVVTFDSVTNMRRWLSSEARQQYLDEGQRFLDGPSTQEVIVGRQPGDGDGTLAAMVVESKVAAGRSDAFLRFQRSLADCSRQYPGFRGSEVFRPGAGSPDHWTVVFRFDTVEHLDAWLLSEDRRELLRGSEFRDFQMKRVDHAFGSWFSEGNDDPRPPSRSKTSIAVWLGLYPTVMVLTLLLSPLQLPMWLSLLIGNLLGSLAMTYFTMPFYVNRLLSWWLAPRRTAAQPATDIRGFLLVFAINAGLALVFYVLTVRIWT